MERVSIVLPCYNHAKYIGDAIESVLKQSYTDYVLYVFDNGSSDNSWMVINQYEDNRIVKIRLKKNNLLEVKKQFIRMAKGEYFAILYSDDVWLPEKLEKQMKLFDERSDARICFTWAEQVDEKLCPIEGFVDLKDERNKSVKEWWKSFMEKSNRLSCPSMVCKKEIYIKHFGRLYPYRQIADMYCWLMILQETNLHIVEEVLTLQRLHPQGANKNESARTPENLAREYYELGKCVYNVINQMDDSNFEENFCKAECNGHIDILCQKFLYLLDDANKIFNSQQLARDFYLEHFFDEENCHVFYEYLEIHYGFSRNDFFMLSVDAKGRVASRMKRWVLLENTDFASDIGMNAISIYGCGQIGKVLARKLKDRHNIVQFIDKAPKLKEYEGIPVYSINEAILDKGSCIVVVPSYDYESIVKDVCSVNDILSQTNFITFEEFISSFEIIDENF